MKFFYGFHKLFKNICLTVCNCDTDDFIAQRHISLDCFVTSPVFTVSGTRQSLPQGSLLDEVQLNVG